MLSSPTASRPGVAASSNTMNLIQIRGAREHNLQSVDLDIPRDAITVITGVSGSGKSSLAFDTLFAEGQRQFIDSLSAYARQYLDQIPRPDVASINGLAPTLAIDQKPGGGGARSTVATISEIYDYLRLLYARVGTPHCAECGSAISLQSSEAIFQSLAALNEGSRLTIASPMIRGRRGVHRETFESIRSAGLIRARVDGEIHLLEDIPPLAPRKLHSIEAIVDRLVIRPGIESRLSESVSLALRLGGGVLTALVDDGEGTWRESIFSTLMACIDCGASFEELEPRTFSFNSPYGACQTCEGLGRIGDPPDVCTDCGGVRLRPEARHVTINDVSIGDLVAMPLSAAQRWIESLAGVLPEKEQIIASPIARDVLQRLTFLRRVGVDYLTLDRAADTLSGGELQRVRLATSIGSGLVGVCYVLDEPSIGLHPADHDRLIDCIRELQQQGNTVVIVEHDEATMRAADLVVDIGPGAGDQGGRIISRGNPDQITRDQSSLTGSYLSGRMRVNRRETRRAPDVEKQLTISGVTTHNLKNVTAQIPLGLLIGISGVSGSGKSSLVNDTLAPAIASELDMPKRPCGDFGQLSGVALVDKLIEIDQSPIGRSSRSCPATYAGCLG